MKTSTVSFFKKGSVLAALVALFTVYSASAQQPKPSPAAKDSIALGGKIISVTYSSPGVKGRDIFSKTGLLSKDGTYPVWRAGANNATVLHTDADLMIGSLHVPKGDYTLFVRVSDPDHWELIINKQVGQWGTIYNPAMDLGHVKMNMSKPKELVERLYYKLSPTGANKATMTLAWENHAGEVDILQH
jgi:hypothetical protein